MSKKEKIDWILSKMISRKLMVFLVSCIGFFTNKMSDENFVLVACIYISSEVAIRYFERGKKAMAKVEKIVENEESEKG